MARPAFFFFDLGNVLFHFDHRLAVRRLAALVDKPQVTVHEVLFDSGLQIRYETGHLNSQQMYQTLCQSLQLRNWPPPDALFHAISDIFWLNIRMVPLVTQMVAAGHRLGILSNTCEAHWKFLYNRPFTLLRTHFELAVLSYEVRSMKPEPDIYRQAQQRVGLEPAELFFVDDKLENVHGALCAGWQACQFQSPQMLASVLRSAGVPLNY